MVREQERGSPDDKEAERVPRPRPAQRAFSAATSQQLAGWLLESKLFKACVAIRIG